MTDLKWFLLLLGFIVINVLIYRFGKRGSLENFYGFLLHTWWYGLIFILIIVGLFWITGNSDMLP